MPRRARRALAGAVVLAGLCGLCWLGVAWLQLDPLPAAAGLEGPDAAMSTLTLSHYGGDGTLVWTLRAASVSVDDHTHRSQARDVSVAIWGAGDAPSGSPPGLPALTVTAEQLTLDNFSKNLTFSGRMLAEDRQGRRFSTEGARWLNDEQALAGDGPVRVEQADQWSLEGSGFRYDVQRETFEVQGARLVWRQETAAP